MANLKKIIYLSEAQKNELFAQGSITSNNRTITYNENDIYVTPDKSIDTIQLNGTTYTSNNGTVNLGTALVDDSNYVINSLVAPVEETSTASQLYNVGDLFIYNKQLYKTTNTIATSTTIIPNTNCEVLQLIEYIDEKVDEISTMTGATSSTAGTGGLVPAPSAGDDDKFLAGDGTFKSGGRPMVILSYGNSTWNDFITAYNNNIIVYCRASSNSNPATGSQTRMAFMAYVNNAETPTEVEFQYYRSVSSHSATQMGDQVFIYKLTSAGTWSVTVREASVKQVNVSGNGLSASWSNNQVTLSNTMTATDMPMSSSDATLTSTAITDLRDDLGIVENDTTATHTISAGQYVIWNGSLYTADATIANGETLASTGGSKNLTAVSNGGFNLLNGHINGKKYLSGRDYVTVNSNWGSWGSLYSGEFTVDISFNNFFTTVESVIVTPNNTDYAAIVSKVTNTNEKITNIGFLRPTQPTSGNKIYFSWLAIGT